MTLVDGNYVEGKRLAKHIRLNRNRIEAQVRGLGKWHCKRFPLDTPLYVVQAWVQSTKQNIQVAKVDAERVKNPPPVAVVPRDEVKGYCYIYFIRAGLDVKIGRALDPDRRMQELQVGHPLPLSMLAAIPAHCSLERIIHARFAHLRGSGEWFHLGSDLQDFIFALQHGRNPVQLLWGDLVYLDAKRTRRKPMNVLRMTGRQLDQELGRPPA